MFFLYIALNSLKNKTSWVEAPLQQSDFFSSKWFFFFKKEKEKKERVWAKEKETIVHRTNGPVA